MYVHYIYIYIYIYTHTCTHTRTCTTQVLLDVMMPLMSGHEVCMKLRERYPQSSLPVIMISAKSNEENILEGFQSGCIDYVTKPFSRHELLARINAHLSHKQVWREKSESARREHPPVLYLYIYIYIYIYMKRAYTLVFTYLFFFLSFFLCLSSM